MDHGGCYIFLSHSSNNIDVVRRIRNEFESLGQNPIAFHLRCLDENYKGRDEELWNLFTEKLMQGNGLYIVRARKPKPADQFKRNMLI